MKKCYLLLLMCLFGQLVYSQIMWQFKKDTVITWDYFDGDEFNGAKVDTEKWKFWYGWSRSLYGNKERQYYTEGENHFVNNGILYLSAIKNPITAKMVDWMSDNDTIKNGGKFYSLNNTNFEYRAGMIETKTLYKYGFFETRLKIPKNKGYWPAFWLHGGDPNEEIDMMECKSERPNQIHIDTHCPNHCDVMNYFFQKRSYGGWAKTRFNFTKDYAIIACDWDENQVRFYLNGECIGVSNVKFNVEKFLTLNIAVPSDDGPFHPGPNKNDTLPNNFEIDYVRIWKKTSNELSKTKSVQTINASTNVQHNNPLQTKSITKTKSKLVYGKKSLHPQNEIFISLFNGKDFLQITSLGIFNNDKPKFKITDLTNKEIKSGVIENQIFTIIKSELENGNYILSIIYNDKVVQNSFQVN